MRLREWFAPKPTISLERPGLPGMFIWSMNKNRRPCKLRGYLPSDQDYLTESGNVYDRSLPLDLCAHLDHNRCDLPALDYY